MGHVESVNTREQDTGDIDGFGRKRVSQVTTQFDAKQLYDSLPLFIDQETNGTVTITHDTTLAETEVTTAAPGDWAVFQTKQRFNYQTGKSQEIFQTTYNFDGQAGVTKMFGYYTASTTTPFNTSYDGFWLESNASGCDFVTSRTGTETSRVPMADWYDPLDGTGPSGITVDLSNNSINQFDFEWLGVGRVRYFYVSGGARYLAHAVDFTNGSRRLTPQGWVVLDANFKGVYMSSPNQPLRWEIRQTDVGSGTFNFICATVGSEGSLNKLGRVISDNLGTTLVVANSTASKYAMLGIRLQSAKVDTLIDLIDFSVLATTNDNQLIEVWLNPTVSGTFVYNAVADSSVEIAKGTTATSTGGTLLFSQYVSSQSATPVAIENAIRLGSTIAGVVDEIVVTTNPITSNSRVLCSLSRRELS